jgi:hypothetical protein
VRAAAATAATAAAAAAAAAAASPPPPPPPSPTIHQKILCHPNCIDPDPVTRVKVDFINCINFTINCVHHVPNSIIHEDC